MAGQTVCPRCGARDSFIKGYLPETCVCRVCQSQLDWREIPGCGPDCRAKGSPEDEQRGGTSSAAQDPTGGLSPGQSTDRAAGSSHDAAPHDPAAGNKTPNPGRGSGSDT
jgi:hypothetical protein